MAERLPDGGSAVDQNKLKELIQEINKKYSFWGMFAWALSINDEDKSNLEKIYEDNPKVKVMDMFNKSGVYRGRRFAVAKVKQPEHAEFRLLTDFRLHSDEGDLLVFHSHASPCTTTCTNENNPHTIIKRIKKVITDGKWTQCVWVYNVIFKPKGIVHIDEEDLSQGLKNLTRSGIPLANIFRCFTPKNTKIVECISCSSAGEVTKECIDYDA